MTMNSFIMAAGYYGAAVVSAVVPWVNAEILMLSAVPTAGSRTILVSLVLAVSAGQMTGKTIAYWACRRSPHARSQRVQRALERWQTRFDHRPGSALVITFVSALVGIPPFFVVSMAAGTLRVAFGPFLAVGTAGRLIHFALVAFVPELLWRTS